MITLGVDMASRAAKTASCLITWDSDAIKVEPPFLSCTDEKLNHLIKNSDAVGIDAPFGWPLPFAQAVKQWAEGVMWQEADWDASEDEIANGVQDVRKDMRLRATDLEVLEKLRDLSTQKTSVIPLSVSSDKIAIPAMRTMALLQRHQVTDRSDDGKFYEVYPAASLKIWERSQKGYKEPKSGPVREGMMKKFKKDLESLNGGTMVLHGDLMVYAQTDHALDAFVAALTVRAATLGNTYKAKDVNQKTLKRAQKEGWIHLPCDKDVTRCLSGSLTYGTEE